MDLRRYAIKERYKTGSAARTEDPALGDGQPSGRLWEEFGPSIAVALHKFPGGGAPGTAIYAMGQRTNEKETQSSAQKDCNLLAAPVLSSATHRADLPMFQRGSTTDSHS